MTRRPRKMTHPMAAWMNPVKSHKDHRTISPATPSGSYTPNRSPTAIVKNDVGSVTMTMKMPARDASSYSTKYESSRPSPNLLQPLAPLSGYEQTPAR